MGPVYGRMFQFGIRPVPVRLELERTHGLGMAVVAALADVKVPAFQFERRVRLHLVRRDGGRAHEERDKGREQRADKDGKRRQYDKGYWFFIDIHGSLLCENNVAA